MNRKTTALMLSVCMLSAACVSKSNNENLRIMDLPPLKDQFSDYFLIGNIYNANLNNWNTLTHHFNVITAENIMKPAYIASSRNSYSFNEADRFVNRAIDSGLKVVGHTLLWHSQIPSWHSSMANADRETALAAMREYITRYVTHFKGRIYSWDVLNEVFPDGVRTSMDWKTSMRGIGDSQAPNPWYVAIGSDFIYEGFLAARLADTDAILYYNDYNTDQFGKASLIRDMVRDVNERYLSSRDKPAGEDPSRLLIEGIGMQEHHNTGISAASIRNTLELFKPLGVIISVSELDILSQTWSDYSSHAAVTEQGMERQARLYGDLFKVYLEYSDIIERVSFWGITDDNSWRARGQPLIFDSRERPKAAYFSIIEALENHKSLEL